MEMLMKLFDSVGAIAFGCLLGLAILKLISFLKTIKEEKEWHTEEED